MAARVDKVYAVDVSWAVVDTAKLPENLEMVTSDGTSVPVPPGSVDLAYSNQLMEHLHPDDAVHQLRNVASALRPGGRYVCLTPHWLMGPSDISVYFDDVATGLHLKEYTHRELSDLYQDAGFRKVENTVGAKGLYQTVPIHAVLPVERICARLPPRIRRRVARTALYPWLRIHHVVTK